MCVRRANSLCAAKQNNNTKSEKKEEPTKSMCFFFDVDKKKCSPLKTSVEPGSRGEHFCI